MEKIKAFIDSERGRNALTIVILILVGLGSFELGRLSVGADKHGIEVEYLTSNAPQTANALQGAQITQTEPKTDKSISSTQPSTTSKEKPFFASNRGRKYYSVDCSAGNNLKMENRVYFDSREEAESAGYELSSACR